MLLSTVQGSAQDLSPEEGLCCKTKASKAGKNNLCSSERKGLANNKKNNNSNSNSLIH